MKPKNKVLRYLLIAVGVLIVLAIIGKKAGWIGKEEKKQVTAQKVDKRSITETVSANGKIQPEVDVKISPDVSGEIVELTVKEGQHVNKGELLIKIKPDIYLSAIDRMTANVNTSKANLENTKAHLIQAKAQFINA